MIENGEVEKTKQKWLRMEIIWIKKKLLYFKKYLNKLKIIYYLCYLTHFGEISHQDCSC